MSDEELKRRMGKGRRLWDHHGSWLLLVMIGISCFMAGGQLQSHSSEKSLRAVIESHERQDAQRVARIRELLGHIGDLQSRLVPQASQAAKKAEQAAQKASEALDRASSMQH